MSGGDRSKLEMRNVPISAVLHSAATVNPERDRNNMHGIRYLLCCALLTSACTGAPARQETQQDHKVAAVPAAPTNPYPSTYQAGDATATLIRGATVLTGTGARLDNADVLKSPAYDAIGNHARGGDNLSVWSKRVTARTKILMRFEGERIVPYGGVPPKDAPALLLNAMSVAPEYEHEFNDWYDTEHIPALGAVPGTLYACRYRGTGAAAQRSLAVYYLTSAEIPNSAAWKAAANTPWTERIRPHFRNHLRIVSRRYRRCAP